MVSAVTAAQPAAEGQATKSAPEPAGNHIGTYRDARPGEPFSLGGKYVYSLRRSILSHPTQRRVQRMCGAAGAIHSRSLRQIPRHGALDDHNNLFAGASPRLGVL